MAKEHRTPLIRVRAVEEETKHDGLPRADIDRARAMLKLAIYLTSFRGHLHEFDFGLEVASE